MAIQTVYVAERPNWAFGFFCFFVFFAVLKLMPLLVIAWLLIVPVGRAIVRLAILLARRLLNSP